MKNYKEYEKKYIGSSDIAALTVRICDKVYSLNFGEDGEYFAYIVDSDCEIGKHYNLIFEGKHFINIYDDKELSFKFYMYGAKIKVYRAGDFGCIIQIL